MVIIGHLARLALVYILGIAGLLKAADIALFADQIVSYQILPSLAPVMARVFVIVELGLAAALLANWRPRFTLPSTGALMLLFIGAITWAWTHGYTGPCGCFGTRGSKGPGGALLEDIVFVALAVIGYFGLRRLRGARAWQTGVALLGVALGAVLPIVAAQLPIDALVTDSRAGERFDHIIVEGFDGDIEDGEYLFALLDPADPRIADVVGPLNALVDEDDMPEVVAVFQGTNDDVAAFMFEHDGEFEMGHAPRAGLRRFYRRLPVHLIVRDGEILGSWFGEVPRADQVRAVR